MKASDAHEFRDLASLVSVLKWSLGLFIVVALAGLWSGWAEIQLLERIASGESITQAEAYANDSRQAVLGILYVLIFIVTAFLFARWTFLSSRNARALGATAMRFRPGWSVGWYFVPLFAFWKPYQALKEIFQASHPDYVENWKEAPRPGIMPLWWTLWLVASFLGHALFRMTFSAETIDEMLTGSWMELVSSGLDVLLAIVVIMLVTRLHDWQSRKYKTLLSTGIRVSEMPRGKVLLNEQSIAGALVGGLCGAVIGFVVYVVPFHFGHGSGFFLLAGGVVTGLLVQFCARGIEVKYGVIAVAFVLLSHLAAWAYVGIYGIGAIILLPSLAFAFMLSFRRLSPDDQKAYTLDNLE